MPERRFGGTPRNGVSLDFPLSVVCSLFHICCPAEKTIPPGGPLRLPSCFFPSGKQRQQVPHFRDSAVSGLVVCGVRRGARRSRCAAANSTLRRFANVADPRGSPHPQSTAPLARYVGPHALRPVRCASCAPRQLCPRAAPAGCGHAGRKPARRAALRQKAGWRAAPIGSTARAPEARRRTRQAKTSSEGITSLASAV